MGAEQLQIFTSLLALTAFVGGLGLLIVQIASKYSALAREITASVRHISLWLAALVASCSTLGSLYFSAIAHYTPCRLCWWQRIAMFPLAAILIVAAGRKDGSVKWYAAPLAAGGLATSIYHATIEWFPQLEKTSCAVGAPCTAVWFRGLGFMSLSMMAASGFFAILVLLLSGEPYKETK